MDIEKNDEIKYDEVNRPKRYTKDTVECIDAMRCVFGDEAVINFCLCNLFKYLWRRHDKGGQQDIDKSVWYFDEAKRIMLLNPELINGYVKGPRKELDK